MDKYEHRRLRLQKLRMEECGGVITRLAEKIDRSPSYVGRMLGEEGSAGKKRIAEDMVDVLEAAFDLPRGWFDMPQDAPVQRRSQLPAVKTNETASSAVHTNKHYQSQGWPFEAIDLGKISRLDAKMLLRLEGAFMMAASQLNVDIAMDRTGEISDTFHTQVPVRKQA